MLNREGRRWGADACVVGFSGGGVVAEFGDLLRER